MSRFVEVLVALAAMLSWLPIDASAQDGEMLFRSGFEPDVYVTQNYRDNGNAFATLKCEAQQRRLASGVARRKRWAFTALFLLESAKDETES